MLQSKTASKYTRSHKGFSDRLRREKRRMDPERTIRLIVCIFGKGSGKFRPAGKYPQAGQIDTCTYTDAIIPESFLPSASPDTDTAFAD